MYKILLFLFSLSIFSQTENFDSLNALSESPNFTITNPVASGSSYNGELRWYHNTEQTIADNSFFQMLGFQPYSGSGFAYLNAGMEGYSNDFTNVKLVLNEVNISTINNPFLSFYSIHPDGSEIINVYVNSVLVYSISNNSSVWVKNVVDLSSYANETSATIEIVGSGDFDAGELGVGIDELSIYEESSMTFLSAISQTVNCNLNPGFDNQVALKTTIATTGSLSPLNLQQLIFSNNSANFCNNISNISLYKSEIFTKENLIGSYNPSTETTFTTTTELNNGGNNYWLTVGLKEGAVIGDVLEFELTSVTISGEKITNITNNGSSTTVNTTGYFLVENLNPSGAGSFVNALSAANNFNQNGSCNGTAIIDLRNLSGTIVPSAGMNHSNDNTSFFILGPRDHSLIIDGSNIENSRLIYSFSKASIMVDGLDFTNFSGNEIIYKPNSKGSLTIKNSSFYGNSGRILYLPNNSSSKGELVFSVENSTFSNNTADSGNLIYIPNFSGIVSFKNTTFFNNSSKSGLMYIVNGGELNIESCTFLNNNASDTNKAGVIEGPNLTSTIKNSIFDSNSPYDLSLNSSTTITNSFISNSSKLPSLGTYQNILTGVSGLESTLTNENNVSIIKLQNTSKLINAGSSDAINKDQRGFYRFGAADIGAYEFGGINDTQPPLVPDFIESSAFALEDGQYIHVLPAPSNVTDSYSEVVITNNICFPLDNTAETFEVIWTFTDENKNSVSRSQIITITKDITIPVIALLGYNPETIEVGALYTDAGAIALDNYDGNLTSSIVVTGTVDSGTVGSYTLRYNVTNSNSNAAITVARTVHVVDTIIPVITLLGNDPESIEVGATYTDAGATSLDNYDGDLTSSIIVTGTVDSDIVGSYTLRYNVSDANSNAAIIVTRMVNVVDTSIPVITLVGESAITVEVGGSYNDAGATAADDYDGDLTASIVVTGTVDTNTVGEYTISYDVLDAGGNAATTVTRTVNVQVSLGLNKTENNFVHIYPNPTESIWILESSKVIERVEIFNMIGQKLLEIRPIETTVRIDSKHLVAGVYIAKIDNSSVSIKLVKK
jgi:hypothetical protein